MKKMMMSMMVMIMASSMAMNANNVNTADNKGNNVTVVDNHGHDKNKGHNGYGNNGHNNGHLGNHNHNAYDRHFKAEVDRHCMMMDRSNRGFRWTKKMVRAHRGDRHIFTREVVKGYRTGHMVCAVCGYHVW